jgi:hypothetical protein
MKSSLFKSFWIGGFESACHINRAGARLDMIATTQHDLQAAQDYGLLQSVGIRTARDGVRWHLIDRGGRYEFSSLLPMVRAARQADLQVVWNLCHYGWPEDVELLQPAFVDRFARYCGAVARLLRDETDEVPFFAPVNEISFFCWAASRFMFPYAEGSDFEIKCQLVRAAIAGMEAIWDVDPRARFVHGDPIINVVPPRGRPDLAAAAEKACASQFEAWDMLAGRLRPDLGGNPNYLDLVGANFYHSNQWEFPDQRLRWEDDPLDDRWVPLHKLLAGIYHSYGRPVVIAETSHFGAGRARWIREIGVEVCRALGIGVPVEGICIYPILDRHDWEDPSHWHHAGLWDVLPDGQGLLGRVLNEEYAAAFETARDTLTLSGC